MVFFIPWFYNARVVADIAIPKIGQNRTLSGILEMAYPEHIKKRALELKKGRSAGAVLRLLEKEFPEEVTSLNARTILRWVGNESEALNETSVRITSEQEMIYPERWKEHNAKLAGVADRLLANDLKRVMKWVEPAGDIEYLLWDESETHILERLTEDDLSGQFEQNIHLAYQEYTEWFFKECFLPHLYAEWSEELRNKGFYIVSYEQPYQLIETLRLLAERKTFKGTCPVCKDYHSKTGGL